MPIRMQTKNRPVEAVGREIRRFATANSYRLLL
jgi:hypothetical protein